MKWVPVPSRVRFFYRPIERNVASILANGLSAYTASSTRYPAIPRAGREAACAGLRVLFEAAPVSGYSAA
jgi:hypothetical protein